MFTLVAHLTARLEIPQPPNVYNLRPCRPSDIPALAHLYFEAFDPGVACATLEEALADMDGAFAGEFGDLWREASPVAIREEQLVGACLVVRRGPWEDTPSCPWINDLFVSRAHRRRGLADALVREAMRVVAGAGHDAIALRVDEDNIAALGLYRKLGFEDWPFT